MPAHQAASKSANRYRVILDRANMPDLATPSSISRRDRDGGLVHVKTDERANFLHDDLPWLAGPTPETSPGCGSAALKGHVIWPRAEEGVVVLSRAQLSMLLEGDRLADAATDLAAATGQLSLVW